MITIVVPAYNAETFLRVTLDSVLAQTYTDWELIVVDDGSKDQTTPTARTYAEKDARIQVFTIANGGCAAARNYGAAQASAESEYIIFLDHDDLWEPHALETLLATAHFLPEGVGAFAGARVLQVADSEQAAEIVARQSKQRRRVAESRNTLTFADLTRLNHIWTMGQVLIRRSALQAVGPLDSQSAPVDDWDLYLRLTLRGPLAATDVPIIYWRSHDSNTSNNRELMQKAEDYVRTKLLNSPDISPTQRVLAENQFRHALRNLSLSQFRWARESLARLQFGQAMRQMRRAIRNYAYALREETLSKSRLRATK